MVAPHQFIGKYHERYEYNKNQITYTNKSLLLPDTDRTQEETRLICPRCKTQHCDLDHGEDMTCECGLSLQRYGNALYIWEDE